MNDDFKGYLPDLTCSEHIYQSHEWFTVAFLYSVVTVLCAHQRNNGGDRLQNSVFGGSLASASSDIWSSLRKVL